MRSISFNTTLIGLPINVIIGNINITGNDICHICDMVTVNTRLEILLISHCPHITKFAEQEMTKVLDKKKSLQKLIINDVWLINC